MDSDYDFISCLENSYSIVLSGRTDTCLYLLQQNGSKDSSRALSKFEMRNISEKVSTFTRLFFSLGVYNIYTCVYLCKYI